LGAAVVLVRAQRLGAQAPDRVTPLLTYLRGLA